MSNRYSRNGDAKLAGTGFVREYGPGSRLPGEKNNEEKNILSSGITGAGR